MLIAQQKRKENIAEYLLYMWQVEDIIRGFQLDIQPIKEHIISRYQVEADDQKAIEQWYEDLITMMRLEGVKDSGHLQINTNVLNDLEDLSKEMLADPTETKYKEAFFKASQDIFQVSQKANLSNDKPIAVAFNALYGMLTMKLKKQEVTPDTQASMERIQKVVALLAYRFHHPKKED